MKKHTSYTKDQYDVELFSWLAHTLVDRILDEQLGLGRCTREFTKGAWEILQKIAATMPTKDGTTFTPEPAPESIMLSEAENARINYDFTGKCMELMGNALANFFGEGSY